MTNENAKTFLSFLMMFIIFFMTSTIFADEDIEVKGYVTEIGDNYFVLQNYKFYVDSSTEFEGNDDSNFNFSSLRVNDYVKVKGKLLSAGNYLAVSVELEDNHDNDDKDELELKGYVTEIGDNYFVLQNYKFYVDSSTEFEGNDDSNFNFSSLRVNDFVKVKGKLLSDGNYLAVSVKLKDIHDDEFEIEGIVDGVGNNQITVSGFLFYITPNTKFKAEDNSHIDFSDISTGMHVKIKGFNNSDNSYTATKVKVKDLYDENEMEISGVISEIGTNTFKVSGMQFYVNNSTIIKHHSDLLLPFSSLTVGMLVEVKAITQNNGSLLATKVKIEDNHDLDEEIEITAQIENINNLFITVGGITFKIDSYTEILDDNSFPVPFSSLQQGMLVKVKGYRQTDGSVLAVKIKIEDFFRDDLELKGRIEALGNDLITVAGKTFSVNQQTLVFDHNQNPIPFSSLSVGLIVEIKGKTNSSGNLTAVKIKIEDEEDLELYGSITALFDNRFEVGNNIILVNENTVVLNYQAQVINYSDLNVGMMVEVKMTKNADGSFMALRIKIENSPGMSKIHGLVDDNSNGFITVALTRFGLNSNETVLSANYKRINISDVKKGDEVILWAEKNQNGNKQVIQIQKINDSITGVENYGKIKNDFILEQNYPNPFNPSTVISFSIRKSGVVKLSVYNAIGQKIADLLNKHLESGKYKINFDARGIASGIYFYSLDVGGKIQTKKMILLR